MNKMEIGQKVKRLYIDHKGNKHLSCQTGEIVGFTTSYGYPAALCHFFKYSEPGFNLREHYSTNYIDELEVI